MANKLPEGTADPNLIYIAVGKAIHAWESMEQALGDLYLKLKGIAETPSALAEYGAANGTFALRMAALSTAAEHHFVGLRNQAIEGEFSSLISEVMSLAIERHRLAHGHITMAGELNIPQGPGTHTIEVQALYRWGAPFYATTKLRTDPFGKGVKEIDVLTDQFMELHNRAISLTNSL